MLFSLTGPAARIGGLLLGLLACGNLPAEVITFDDLTLIPDSHFAGPTQNAVGSAGPFPGTTEFTGTFTSGGVEFTNRVLEPGGFWSGFAYSNETNTTMAGFGNQFATFAGADHTPAGNGIFGLAFDVVELAVPTFEALQRLPHFSVPTGMVVAGAFLTNTTYAALSMRDGDAFAKKFGGVSGNDADYLLVRAYGVDALGNIFASRPEFYLSDFRAADNSQDYILDDWGLFDLSSLAGAATIHFDMETTDVEGGFSNTPMYFAIDDIELAAETVPEPSSGLLAIAAAGAIWRVRRRKRAASQGFPPE